MKTKEETRRFDSVTLGLPPLKMILVNTDEESNGRAAKKTTGQRKTKKELENRQLILKLIEHLTGTDR